MALRGIAAGAALAAALIGLAGFGGSTAAKKHHVRGHLTVFPVQQPHTALVGPNNQRYTFFGRLKAPKPCQTNRLIDTFAAQDGGPPAVNAGGGKTDPRGNWRTFTNNSVTLPVGHTDTITTTAERHVVKRSHGNISCPPNHSAPIVIAVTPSPIVVVTPPPPLFP